MLCYSFLWTTDLQPQLRLGDCCWMVSPFFLTWELAAVEKMSSDKQAKMNSGKSSVHSDQPWSTRGLGTVVRAHRTLSRPSDISALTLGQWLPCRTGTVPWRCLVAWQSPVPPPWQAELPGCKPWAGFMQYCKCSCTQPGLPLSRRLRTCVTSVLVLLTVCGTMHFLWAWDLLFYSGPAEPWCVWKWILFISHQQNQRVLLFCLWQRDRGKCWLLA